jgi:putative transposase
MNKCAAARELGIARSTLYYRSKQEVKDWKTKQLIEEVLSEHPSYGHKRLAIHLGINKKRVLRVMKKYGIKPYRRHTKKWKRAPNAPIVQYQNLLRTNAPQGAGDIWVSDFTHVVYKGQWIYIATILDMYTRECVGVSVLTTHATVLVSSCFLNAILHRAPPRIIHSDQGSEYSSLGYTNLVESRGTKVSMSAPGCPWENGYQESFYGKFKLDLGDPNRFESLGELVTAIYQTIHTYNTSRIHTALKMPPQRFASLIQDATMGSLLVDMQRV